MYEKVMNVLGKLSAFLFVIFIFVNTGAQDIHFSQFYASPLNVSPANTGNFSGDWRAGLNYRRQWAAINPFKTLDLFFDMPVYYKKHVLSLGGLLINDRTNDNNMNVSKLYVSGAYHKNIRRHIISGGLQIGMALYSANDDLVFIDQYDPSQGSFSSNPSAESINTHPFHIDINAGIGWYRRWDKIRPQVNYSIFHLNQPKEAFISDDSRLKMRQVIYIGADYYALDKVYFTPQLIYMSSNGASDMYFGTNATFILNKNVMEQSVFGGVYFKNEFNNFDAFVAVIGVNWNEWQAGISYDFNVSPLKVATNSRGAFEISLIYKDFSSRISTFKIPCERF